jgi:hypothetical protein
MIRKAPSPVPFEGGLACRPEDRAAPALVIEPTCRRFAPPCPLPPRVDAAMRDLAHQKLGVLPPGLRLRCGAAVRAIQRPCAPITVYVFPTGDFCLGVVAVMPSLRGRITRLVAGSDVFRQVLPDASTLTSSASARRVRPNRRGTPDVLADRPYDFREREG